MGGVNLKLSLLHIAESLVKLALSVSTSTQEKFYTPPPISNKTPCSPTTQNLNAPPLPAAGLVKGGLMTVHPGNEEEADKRKAVLVAAGGPIRDQGPHMLFAYS